MGDTKSTAPAHCGVLHRTTGTECGQPATTVVRHATRTHLTFGACRDHAPNYAASVHWTVQK